MSAPDPATAARPGRWWRSGPARVGFFLLVLFLVLFPRVDRFVEMLRRPLDPNAMVDPDSPALVPLEEEFEATRDPDWDRAELLRQLEAFVYHRIQYAFDWDIWGNAHFQPTVEETVALGREDCDGQAIVAASLMRHYGYDANVVGNLMHVWVATDLGEAMSPLGDKLVEVEDGRTRFNWRTLTSLPRDMCFGTYLFPAGRELVLVVAACLALWRMGVSRRRAGLALVLATAGLFCVRRAGEEHMATALALVGFALWARAAACLVISSRRAPR